MPYWVRIGSIATPVAVNRLGNRVNGGFYCHLTRPNLVIPRKRDPAASYVLLHLGFRLHGNDNEIVHHVHQGPVEAANRHSPTGYYWHKIATKATLRAGH